MIEVEKHINCEIQFCSDIKVYDDEQKIQKRPSEGLTIDCMGCLGFLPVKRIQTKTEEPTETYGGNLQSGGSANTDLKYRERSPKIFLHFFSVINDPNAPTLRILEILHMKESKNSMGCIRTAETKRNTVNTLASRLKLGPMSSCFGGFYTDENNETCIDKRHVLHLIKSATSDGGVNMDELVILLQCSSDEKIVRNALQQLQADGEIYQNVHGNYLPL